MNLVWKKISGLALAALILLTSFGYSQPVIAATATDAYDQPSSLKISTASNHSFSITSPSGVAEGDTIVLTFPSSFDTSSIVEDDVDIADDSFDLTTAANCSGSEEASVVMAADVLTITICAGDGGAIAAASTITIEIGANAAASGSGTNKIINPSSVGTYFVDVSGTFGDTASIPIPIITDDDSAFSAIVPSSGGGGGGPIVPSNTVTLTAPVGGEVMSANDVFNISWSSIGVAVVNLYFSADNGSSYSSLAQSLPANGSYSWVVPDIDTSEALIRAEGTDLAVVIASDASSVFTIISTTSPQSITLVYPNGGENFAAASSQVITWLSTGDVTSVDLYYSKDSGLTYSLIASSQSNNGSYSWIVPNISSSTALIRIDARNAAGVVAQDASDSVFSISLLPVINTIQLLAPNGGQTLNADSIYSIEWISGGATEAANLYYSTDGGINYILIANGLAASGTYSWTVPNLDTTQAIVRVDGLIANTIVVSDISDLTFSIIKSTQTEAITVIQPNGGEVWQAESDHTISWSSRGVIDKVDIYFSDNNGQNYYLVASDVANMGAYLWSVPQLTSDQMRIRLEGKNVGIFVANDISDRVFSVTQKIIEPEPEPDPEQPIDEPKGEEKNLRVDLQVARQINLTSVDGTFTVLPGTVGTILAFVEGEDVEEVRVTFNDTDFAVTDLGSKTYSASIPFSDGATTLTVSVDFADGQTLSQSYSVFSTTRGRLSEIKDGKSIPLAGAVVIVYNSSRTQWGAAQFGEANPLLTGSQGALGWYVPNGTYIVTFGKSGYRDAEMQVRVQNNILKPSYTLEMEKIIPPIDVETGEETGVTAVVSVVRDGLSQAIKTVADAIASIREVPEAQTAATVAQPIVIASAVGGAIILATSFNLFPFLQYLFTAPLLFFARRRRRQFGLIYNAFTKVPIDLAIVRLYSEAGKIVKTMVTDQEGRYFFQVDPGFYRIEVAKQGFTFPSDTLKGQKQDGDFLDVYTGGLIEVTDKRAIIAANIPVEPVQAPEKFTPLKIRRRRFLRIFQRMIGFSGAILAVLVWIIQPNPWSLGIMIFQIIVLIITMLLIRPKRKKGWGIVYEKVSKNALRNTIVRLYEPKYNKLLETTITDGKGRYAFLAGANEYFVTYEKPGFAKHTVSPVDYRDKKEPTFVSVDVGMQKTS